MYNIEVVKKLQPAIRQKMGKAFFNSNNTELVIFCPMCERDRFFKNNKKGHLYIATNAPVFNCFKCGFKGVIPKLLNILEIDSKKYISDADLDISINKRIQNSEIEYNNFSNYYTPKLELEKFEDKMKYLTNRFSEYVDLNKIDNIVFDIKEFIHINNIEINKSTENIIDFLQSNFVGFLSIRRSLMICRNIDIKSQFRYYNLHIGKKSHFKDFYGIINSDKKKGSSINTIVLSEGVFDIIQSYNNPYFEELRNDSCLWAAALTCKYNILIQSVLDYSKITKSNIIILSDSEIPMSDYKYLCRYPTVESLVLYYNKKGKDFGELNVDPTKLILK